MTRMPMQNERATSSAKFAVHLLFQLEHEFVRSSWRYGLPFQHIDAYQTAAKDTPVNKSVQKQQTSPVTLIFMWGEMWGKIT